MAPHLLPVEILGASFSLKTTDEDPAHLREVIAFFEKKVKETQQTVAITDPLKLAIISGIIIADELFKERSTAPRDGVVGETVERDEIITNLIERLNSALS